MRPQNHEEHLGIEGAEVAVDVALGLAGAHQWAFEDVLLGLPFDGIPSHGLDPEAGIVCDCHSANSWDILLCISFARYSGMNDLPATAASPALSYSQLPHGFRRTLSWPFLKVSIGGVLFYCRAAPVLFIFVVAP